MLSMRNLLKSSLAALAALTFVAAQAQDWPTYQGQNARAGNNGAINGNGPGQGELQWFYPNNFERKPASVAVDNNDPNAAAGATPPGWLASNPNIEAADPYIPLLASGVNQEPAYFYTREVASQARVLGQNYDPRVPATGTATTFTWVIQPPAGAAGGNYSLYVWAPQGPTADPGGALYPQQYFVYDIQYGNGQHYVDVVDVWQNGWIRLGNGGSTTNRTFPYNGQPFRITLYNTVPRDQNGNLTDAGTNGQVRNDGVVYADAVLAVPDFGAYVASPTVRLNPNIPGTSPTRMIAAFNRFVADTGVDVTGNFSQVAAGEVSSYEYTGGGNPAVTGPLGVRKWKFSLANLRTVSVSTDNPDAVAAPVGSWTLLPPPPLVPPAGMTGTAPHNGADYLLAPIQSASLPTAASVTYDANVADGQYNVEVYCPGPYNPTGTDPSDNVAHAVVVKVFQGVTETDVTLDESQGPGWVSLGKFNHNVALGQPLTVAITDYSADPTDAGKFAYADAVRFSASVTPAVNSTPVQATVNIRYDPANPNVVPPLPQAVDVVLVAAEDGRLYCLDGIGNADGTTNLIWAYPSLPVSYRPDSALWTNPPVTPPNNDPNTPIDPNTDVKSNAAIATKLDGEYGSIIAEMPTGFNTSSALIRRNAGGEDLLYIGANNGRVYCIEMAGRGDENIASAIPGTTRRRWTFPDDYPSVKKPALGAFYGSVAEATTTQGDTIFAPDSQGRLYALDADGDITTRTTTTRWAFPATNLPTLGSIRVTPMVAFNPQRLYFATTMPDDTQPGAIWCIDAANPTNAALQWTRNAVATNAGNVPYDDFLSSPAAATAADLGGGMPDSVFFANMNKYVVAYSADGTQLWATNELGNGVRAPLSINQMQVYDNGGLITGTPLHQLLMVPTVANQFAGLFAVTTEVNTVGGRLAWEYDGEGGNQLAGLSVGRGWMYTGDGGGNLYAFRGDLGSYGGGFGIPPGADAITPNNPVGAAFRDNLKIKVLKPLGAEMLRAVGGTTLTYNDIDTDTGTYTDPTRNPLAFEWGERAQLVVYGFPANPSANDTTRMQYIMTTDGKDGRPRIVEARIFNGTSPSVNGVVLNGYAVIDLAIQGTGPDAMPPGTGRITVSFRIHNTRTGGESVVIPDPTKNFKDYVIANPIGIGMQISGNNLGVTNIVGASSLGKSTNPSDPENLVNGSPDVGAKLGSTMGTGPGILQDGNSGQITNFVWDRSLMTLLRGPGRGLDNIRVQSGDLAWVGQRNSVFKPLATYGTTYSIFEDYPDLFPNVSLDYPNIPRDRVRVTKDPNGTPQNPLFSPATLPPPTIPTDSSGNPLYANRTMVATPFQWQIDVPRYQPPAYNPANYSATGGYPVFNAMGMGNLASGYQSRIRVFVDSNGNGISDNGNGNREALRSFVMTNGVSPRESLQVGTPTVDLGPLANGSGFTPGFPGTASSTYHPRNSFNVATNKTSPNLGSLFRSFTIINDGNVNDLNLRVAKSTQVNGGPYAPWPLFGSTVDELGYLNGGIYIFSDLDPATTVSNYIGATAPGMPAGAFALTPHPILQKPRVGDPSGASMTTNPQARPNGNLGVAALTPLFNSAVFPVQSPKIGIAVPLGFPSGSYTNLLRVIEDNNDDSALALDLGFNSLEPYSNPGLTLKFQVREARVTTTPTKQPRTSANPISLADPVFPMTAPLVDDLEPYKAQPSNYQYANVQPAGMRLVDGTLLLVWVSNRPSDTPAQPNQASANDSWRLYAAALGGSSPYNTTGFTPLRDLDAWNPANAAQWFAKSTSTTTGYPTPSNSLFNVQGGETLLTETVKFGSPALPIQGTSYTSNNSVQPYVAFVGTAQKQTSAGRITENRLFLSQVNVANGKVTLGTPLSMPYDVSSEKSKPFIIQDGANAVIFYSSGTTDGGQIVYTVFNGSTFTKPTSVPVPSGMEAANAPSAVLRPYTGSRPPVDANGNPFAHVIDVSFAGRLRGRNASEVFTVRLATNTPPAPQLEVYQAIISREALTAEVSPGVFRARGLGWNQSAVITTPTGTVNGVYLEQWVDTNRNGIMEANEVVPLEIANTRAIERATGVVTFDSPLGGKVYVDPNMGTVRFSTGSPVKNGVLYLTYQPSTLRASANTTSSYTGSTILFDHRLTSLSVNGLDTRTGLYGPEYWGRFDNSAAGPGDSISNDRYLITYSRGAAGSGQSARPYMKTMRYGVQLPTAVFTRPDGSLLNPGSNTPSISVAGLNNGEFYQVDPAKGRVYFEANTEGKVVSVTYTAVNNAGQVLNNGNQVTYQYLVGLITETEENAIPIEGAANDAAISPFLDPFDAGGNAANRRPGLIWLFWSSNRAGNPDIYMQTLAPHFAPVIGGQ